jgi:hypothetical protein
LWAWIKSKKFPFRDNYLTTVFYKQMTPSFKLWQLDIDETDLNTGVEYVAVVDDPAILRMWQTFAAHKVNYQIASQDRHIVQGPLMIPNMPIYRSDDIHGDHYVMYSKESIEKIVRKFFRQNNTGNVNLMHIPSATTKDVYMIESFIIDSSRGIHAPDGFTNLPEGTWFGTYQVANPEIWKMVQDGTFRGFSVEGYFGYTDPTEVDQTKVENLINAVTSGTPEQIKHLQQIRGNMGVLDKILSPEKKIALQKLLFGDGIPPGTVAAPPVAQADANKAMTKDGTQLYAEGGFVQGSKIYVVTADGQTPAPDGKYELDNGTVCEVTGGTIMQVTDGNAPADKGTPPAANEAAMKALEDKFNAFVTETKTAIETLSASMVQMTEKFTASETSLTEIKGEFSRIQEATKLMYDVFVKLDGTPANEPVDKPKPEIKKTYAEESEAKLRSLGATISKLKQAK